MKEEREMTGSPREVGKEMRTKEWLELIHGSGVARETRLCS